MVANAVTNSKKVEGNLSVERQNEFSARCTWTIPDVKGKIKQKAVWSKYFDVGGYDCRLLLYPGGMLFTTALCMPACDERCLVARKRRVERSRLMNQGRRASGA
jgi:hypothetical protein